jgi:hypothetical protein
MAKMSAEFGQVAVAHPWCGLLRIWWCDAPWAIAAG